MNKFNYAYGSNVILDKCPDCDGIWADAGESKLVAQYLKDDPQANRLAAAMLEMTNPPDIEDPFGSREVITFLYCPRIIVPFADDAQRDKFPIITILLIIISVLFSVVGLMASNQWLADTLDVVNQFGSKFGFSLMGTLFAQGGIIHLAWNMLFLWLFGDNIEDRFSRAGYLLFFLFCGMFSWAIYQITGSQASSFTVALSSAVSAVMGAYLIFYPTANLKLFVVGYIKEIPVVLFIGLWFIFQLIYPFLFGTEASFGSITLAHLTGFALGLTIAFFQKLKNP
jgi:membrane associated rhomboid family serine protease